MPNLSDVVGDGSLIASEALTATAAIGLSTALIEPTGAGVPNAQHALVTNTDGTIRVRFRFDGTNPTASAGHVLGVGESMVIHRYTHIKNLRLIGESGNPVVFVTTWA